MPDFEIVSSDTIAPVDAHAAFVAAFSDYLAGPMTVTFDQWPATELRQGVVRPLGRVAVRDGAVIAFAFVAPRAQGRRWRLAAMGATPVARGSGAAPALLDDFIARAAQAGQSAVELECFVANERAMRLYRSRKFLPRHDLVGYDLAGDVAMLALAGAPHRELAPREAFDWLDSAQRRLGDLPLQVTPASLAATPRPLRFWQRGSALLAWSDTGEGAMQVHSLVDGSAAQADAQALVAGMRATRPDAAVAVSELQRDDLGGAALRRLGLVPRPLHQALMVRPLT